MNEETLTFLLLYDDNSLTDSTNTILLNSVIENVTWAKRFEDPFILES